LAVTPQELPQLALAFFLGNAVLFLVSARELIVPAGDHAQPVIGQPAPLFSHAPAQLLPLAFEAITVHVSISCRWSFTRTIQSAPCGNHPARASGDLYVSAHTAYGLPANLDTSGIPVFLSCWGDEEYFINKSII